MRWCSQSALAIFELLPNGQWAAIYPSELQAAIEPVLLTQMTVQDAIVWHVGVWDAATSAPARVTQEPVAEGAGPLGEVAPQARAAPTPIPLVETKEIELVTLLVTREDALVLKYLHEVGADLDLVLRPANVTGPMLQTQPIWFRYIVDVNCLRPCPTIPSAPCPSGIRWRCCPSPPVPEE